MLFEGNITTIQEFGVPDGREEIRVYTDADVTVAFWMHKLQIWGPEIDVTSPGDFVGVITGRARLTGSANVVVV